MPSININKLLDRLDEAKRRFDQRAHKSTEQILSRLLRVRISDAAALLRLHEALLFVCAYPPSARARDLSESLLKSFPQRVAALRESDEDLSPLDPPDVSGIAGLEVVDTFTYFIVRWLSRRYPTRLRFDWEDFEDENRLAETWPRFMPLLEEDGAVEANVPYQTWLQAATGGQQKEVSWLISRFESLGKTEKEKAELYDSQKLYVAWTPGYNASRTGMRLPVRNTFYHREPLIQRREISLRQELEKPKPVLERLSEQQGHAIFDMARAASTTRYRELYGFTHGDARRVFKASIGRGVDIFVTGIPPEWRLPLRAYHAALIFKNGVPVGYFEGLSLFERMESGFNLYYTFREGETAWMYARTLHIFRHLLGITAFSIDPYQIGYENEEGIESGAFWFYRKLGFRPMNDAIMNSTRQEEGKLSRRKGYRTSPRTLRKLATAPMIFELRESRTGDWDRFQVRNIGLRVQRRMASKFKGDAGQLRVESVRTVSQALSANIGQWGGLKANMFNDFAVALALLPDLARWSDDEKQGVIGIIEAKATADEASYLKLMQKHERLRRAMIKLGS